MKIRAWFAAVHTTTGRALACVATWALVAVLAGPVAHAQAAPDRAALTPEQLLALVREAVEQAAQQVMAAHPGVRVETQVGSWSPQLKLAPCRAAQPHLNPQAKVWGDIRVGLRCTDGAVRWNVYVPATVRVFGPAWVAGTALPAGHMLSDADLVKQEVELSAEAGATAAGPEAWQGRSLVTGLRAGQALRLQHLKARQWFAAGQSVTLVARGTGFAVSSEGIAVTPGLDGQTTQVRLEGGRVVQGVAVGARRVEVSL